MLIDAGVDPIKFLQTPQGSALIAPVREAIGQNYDQARTNMYDWFAGSGFSPQSGMAAGPMANLFAMESSDQSRALQDFISNSMNMGLQGANVLQGQQGIFNPIQSGGLSLQAGNQVINAPRGPGWGLAQSLIGAGGQALGGWLTGGASSVASGGAGGGCLVARELWGETPKTMRLRLWLLCFIQPTWKGFLVRWYVRNGELLAQMVRENSAVRWLASKLFERMHRSCLAQFRELHFV